MTTKKAKAKTSPWQGRVIVLASGKGGVGKTTLAACIAGELLTQGERVALLDADPQTLGGLAQWHETGDALHGAVLVSEANEHAAAVVRSLARDAVVIVDTAGSMTRTTLALLKAADLVVVPARPSALDATRAVDLVRLVEESSRAPCVVAMNACGRGAMPGHIRAELVKAGLKVLRAELGTRTAFAASALHGAAPAMLPGAGVARAEVAALVAELRRSLR
jgi:chromosome partitioning protein